MVIIANIDDNSNLNVYNLFLICLIIFKPINIKINDA